jgi:hypothetical protein
MRNEALDANTFTNNFHGTTRPLDHLFDYAFSFGSPMYIPKLYNGKNRSFFHATYERAPADWSRRDHPELSNSSRIFRKFQRAAGRGYRPDGRRRARVRGCRDPELQTLLSGVPRRWLSRPPSRRLIPVLLQLLLFE